MKPQPPSLTSPTGEERCVVSVMGLSFESFYYYKYVCKKDVPEIVTGYLRISSSPVVEVMREANISQSPNLPLTTHTASTLAFRHSLSSARR